MLISWICSSLQYLSCSGIPKTEHSTPDAASQLLKLAPVLQSQPKKPLAFFATKAHCTLSGSSSCPPEFLHPFLQSHFLASSLPACSSAWGYFIPFVGHLDWSFFKSTRFLSMRFPSLLRSLRIATLLSRVLIALLSLILICL